MIPFFFTKDLCWIGAGVLHQLLHIVLHLDTVNQNADEHSQEMWCLPKRSNTCDLQVITPYECEYTVMLSPPSAPVVKESTGITMFIIDEMREAKEAKARLAKVNINNNFNFQTWKYMYKSKWRFLAKKLLMKQLFLQHSVEMVLWMQKLLLKMIFAMLQDELIKKMAMEQKRRREVAAREERRIRVGQNPHVYNAQLLWHPSSEPQIQLWKENVELVEHIKRSLQTSMRVAAISGQISFAE